MAYVPQLVWNYPDNTRTSNIYHAWNPLENLPTPIDPSTGQQVRPWRPNYGMPNCTAYAWSRFWAICNPTSQTDRRPTLSIRNACYWYGNTQDGYERGQTPKLGAVACWETIGDFEPGHVGIVEEIRPDGTIVTSNSNWTSDQSQEASNFFYTMTLSPPYNLSDSTFQGFIYNPYAEQGGKLPKIVLLNKLMRRKRDDFKPSKYGNTLRNGKLIQRLKASIRYTLGKLRPCEIFPEISNTENYISF